MTGPPTVPGWDLNPGPLSFEASALLTELMSLLSATQNSAREKSPLYCRLLLNMYVGQELRVGWKSSHCSYLNVSNNGNGVKQVRVILPILFDGMLVELETNTIDTNIPWPYM